MSYICQICNKATVHGGSQQHKRGVAGKRWKDRTTRTERLFKPNLQKVTVKYRDEKSQMLLCTKCIKRIKKFGEIKDYSNIAVV
jgi:ribosomal protein L28